MVKHVFLTIKLSEKYYKTLKDSADQSECPVEFYCRSQLYNHADAWRRWEKEIKREMESGELDLDGFPQ